MKPESLRQLAISANFAISADGKISSIDHRPSGWTSPADHQRLLSLRCGADALFVGHRTLIADNMSLTVPHQAQQPMRCIASASGSISGNEKIFHTAGGDIHVWCQKVPATTLSQTTLHHGSLTDFLLHLHTICGVKHLHCEGGGTLLRLLLEIDCLDELHLTWAGHTLFSGEIAPTLSGIPGLPLAHSHHFALTHFEPLPDTGEIFLSYRNTNA
jgi:2,5-diamino-6-(ribosylamino)-4(3H)-pyrimidinone 5'-phosphate reductase